MEAATSNQPTKKSHFPFPSGVSVADYVTLKLSPTSYFAWKQLMLSFLVSQELSGFVDGTIDKLDKPPPLDMSSDLLEERWQEKWRIEEDRRNAWKQGHFEETRWETELQDDKVVQWMRTQDLLEVDPEHEQEHREGWEEWNRGWKRYYDERLRENDPQEWGRRKEWDQMRQLREKQKKKLEEEDLKFMEWKRSDDLVRGWTLALVTQEMLLQVIHLKTARDVWIQLGKILTPTFHLSRHNQIDMTNQEKGESLTQYKKLHKAALKADWDTAAELFDNEPDALFEPITWGLETALMVAVRSVMRNKFVKKLIPQMVRESRMRKLMEEKMMEAMEREMMEGMERVVNMESVRQSTKNSIPEVMMVSDSDDTVKVETTEAMKRKERMEKRKERKKKMRENMERMEKETTERMKTMVEDMTKRMETMEQDMMERMERIHYSEGERMERMERERMQRVEMMERVGWREREKIKSVERRERERIVRQGRREREMPERMESRATMEGMDAMERDRVEGWKNWMNERLQTRMDRMLQEIIKWIEENGAGVNLEDAAGDNRVVEEGERERMLQVKMDSMKKTLRERMRELSIPLLGQRDVSGATALHAAVEGGNINAARWLVQENKELADMEDTYKKLPVHVAAELGNRMMVEFLLLHTTKASENKAGHKLLLDLASTGLYDIALRFLRLHPKLACMEPSPLGEIAQKRTSYLRGTNLSFFQRFIYSESLLNSKSIRHQALDLVKVLCKEAVKNDFKNAAKIFKEPLMKATSLGMHEIVEEILGSFPSAIHLRNEMNQSLFHLAIVYRREKVFNLIYQMEEDQRALLSMPDASTNNALHLAGDLELQQQLLLRASATGAVLQMQRELQWFKEVEKFLLPQAKEHMNADRKTPQEVFTETHKDLVKEGEKWMKDTATSCTITAALITTILFAAAITVPGGSYVDTGVAIQLGSVTFTLFGVFDAIALLASSASLLIFLSILTCRYSEHDFLHSLPTRMIIGLATLFLSILSMMVAFAVTFIILFGITKWWRIILAVLPFFVPVVVFARSQFPLLLAMIQSTYFPRIFRKQSIRTLH